MANADTVPSFETSYSTNKYPNLSSSGSSVAADPVRSSSGYSTAMDPNQTATSGSWTCEPLRPVVQNVKDQANKTTSEFQDLANSRTTPAQPAATGQSLTQYHNFFYKLFTWKNPRATGISFACSIMSIFAARYLDVLKYFFRFSYIVLGIMAALEVAGKLLFDNGIASRMRPRKYWTIPRESLDRSVDDVEQLLNFFVIESQRVLFAENVYATIAVFAAALMSYGLYKIVPFWGLSLIGDCVLFLTPLVYIRNREVIDAQVEHVEKVISHQAVQIKDITTQQATKATETVKGYTAEYTSKAQQIVEPYIGSQKTSATSTSTRTEPVLGNGSLSSTGKHEGSVATPAPISASSFGVTPATIKTENPVSMPQFAAADLPTAPTFDFERPTTMPASSLPSSTMADSTMPTSTIPATTAPYVHEEQQPLLSS